MAPEAREGLSAQSFRDIPGDSGRIKTLAASLGLRFDAVNSNSFQDQPGQAYSYKFGSLQHVDAAVRRQASIYCVSPARGASPIHCQLFGLLP